MKVYDQSLGKGEWDKVLPASRSGQVGHRVGERYEALHELPG